MEKYTIITAIKDKVGGNYGIWTIGVTDDPDTRKSQHESEGENVKYWSHWKTNSEKDGRDIESYFLGLGMKGGEGGGGKAGYVYIF
jgi:hypothetical protein